MVRAEDVEEQLVSSRELVPVVRDVRCEVGGFSVGPYEHPVLVVAELRRPQPKRSVALIRAAAGPQRVERLFDGSGLVERSLREPAVEADPIPVERGPDPIDRDLERSVGDGGEIVSVNSIVGEHASQLLDVFALVGILRRLDTAHPRRNGAGEAFDLAATVVDIELAAYLVAD